MNLNNMATVNPETLFIENEGLSAEEILNGIPAHEVATLAGMLDRATAVDIGRLLADYQSKFTVDLNEHLSDMLGAKILEATPDEIEDIVVQAKRSGREVWRKVRLVVMKMNDRNAESVSQCQNLPALDLLLTNMSKADGWLARPVYDSAIKVVKGLISESNMTQLDDIGEFVGKWRCRGVVLPAMKERDAELVRIVSRFEKVGNYVLQSEQRRVVIKNARQALRISEKHGWTLVG